ncbi:efflux RND transporter permease subunit [Meridianimarinicoccus sp. RP-17]|uniref:efflux RND transporter permease subunit n=1 Tax=Meridianimarinicoccus zhengii TaxID=2056810 RepID=UPI000DAD68B0|nr:multidrug efflux RND transporter permease subunit [Phycocomes zhengii]
MFSSIFISKPKMAMVISLVLVLLGAIGYVSLPVAQFPEITPPVVSVSASYPGANAETVEATVAAPIEAQVNGVDGMIYMSSTSDDNGGYSLSVSFAVGTDPDIAAVNVQNRVAQAMASLPTEVTDGGVVTRKASTNMLLVAVLDSPGGTHDEVFLSNYASINLRDALSRVPGVGEATVLTDFAYAMRIWLDPQRMASLGLTPGDIVAAIRDQNLEVSAGQIGSPPVPGDQQFQYTITAQGRLTSAAEFGNIVVRSGTEGGLVRIRDVARVELGSSFYSASGRFSGNPATVLAVYQAPGANALSVAGGVKAELDRLSEAFPDDVRVSVPYDSTLFVEQSLNDVIETLVIAFVLVISVVFLFLGSWRATVIPAVAIPVSLIGTFAVLMVLGMSLNTISLFALVLAIGIVVDDAIIVVENVESIMARDRLPPAEATRKAMVQITGPVIATTLVLLAVFVPVLFMPGITGRMFSQFAITISAAVVISSINALTLSPALCALLLRPRKGALTGPLALFERGIDGVRAGYVALVRRVARVAVVSVVAVAGIVAALVVLTDRVPSGFLPDEDNGVIFVDVQLPDAASLSRTETVSRRLEEQILQIGGVADTVLVNGFSLLGGSGSNGAMIIVTLDPWDARTTPATRASGILRQVYGIAGQEAAASVLAFNPPPIPGLGMGAGVDMMVQQTGGGTAQDLAAAVGSLVYTTNQQPEIAQAYSTFRANVPKFFVDLDRDKAQTLDVAVRDVFAALQAYMGSFYVNDFNLFGRVYRVMLQADGDFRTTVDDIGALHVRSGSGAMVPLGTLVDVENVLGPVLLNRYNMFRATTVTAVPGPGFATGDAIRVLEEQVETALPPGFAFEWTGTALQQLEAGGAVQIILGLAVLFGYLFLVAQYESWTMPVAIFMSVTVALLGAVMAVWIVGGDLNLYTQIGMIMLIGLGAKNAILIVEFAMERRAEGMDRVAAGLEAASQRFRAVMMTALSFLLGVVPLLIASGAGAASQRALGAAVFGGMLAATVVGLILVPLLYMVLQGLRERLKGGHAPGT